MTEKIKAAKRELFGKKVKKMRQEGLLPAVIYGAQFESLPIQISLSEFQVLYKKAGTTQLLNVTIESIGEYPVLIKQVQVHPLSDLPMHVDFYKVDLSHKVTAKVPVKFNGEAEAVKNNLGVFLDLLSEIEVEALPTEIPAAIDVDITSLANVNDMILVKDLKLPTSVEIKVDPEELVCKIGAFMKEEVETVELKPEDVIVEKEKKAEEAAEKEETK